jgi:hypothetical protein
MIVWRVAQTGGYVAMATVGGVMLIEPSPMISGQMGDMATPWAVMMLAGGILGAWAMLSRIWAGETLGLPLLWAGTGMWGVAYLRSLPYTSGRFAAGVFLLGVTLFLFAHWRAVFKFGDEAIAARLYEKRYHDGKH